MGKFAHNTSVQNCSTRRLVVILVCVSVALQALAFAIPGGVLGLLCRAVGMLLLVMALLAALKGDVKSNSFLATRIGIAAGLAAIALVAVRL